MIKIQRSIFLEPKKVELQDLNMKNCDIKIPNQKKINKIRMIEKFSLNDEDYNNDESEYANNKKWILKQQQDKFKNNVQLKLQFHVMSDKFIFMAYHEV